MRSISGIRNKKCPSGKGENRKGYHLSDGTNGDNTMLVFFDFVKYNMPWRREHR